MFSLMWILASNLLFSVFNLENIVEPWKLENCLSVVKQTSKRRMADILGKMKTISVNIRSERRDGDGNMGKTKRCKKKLIQWKGLWKAVWNSVTLQPNLKSKRQDSRTKLSLKKEGSIWGGWVLNN